MPAYGTSIVGALFPELTGRLFSARRGANDYRLSSAERELKVADLLALAVLADGKVTDEEWAALERIGDPDAVIEWRRRAVELTDRDTLRRTAAVVAAPLTPAERERVLVLMGKLVEAGAGLADGDGGYRYVAPADGEALLSLFRDALGG